MMEKACEGLLPASELTIAQSSLSIVEKRVAELERELKAEKADASSAKDRAKAAITATAEERKVSDALMAGLQTDLSGLQDFITGCFHPLIGEFLLLVV